MKGNDETIEYTRLKVQATMEISEKERERIEQAMSRAMGAQIMSTGKTDFAQWSKEEWMALVGVAFNHCAPVVFQKRVFVSEPLTVIERDEIPF